MIWITQWLCLQRHCSIALAWDDTETGFAAIEAKGEAVYASGAINRWCGICHGDLHIEHGRSRFGTIAEAQPCLEQLQEDNLRAMRLLQGQKN